MANLLVELGVEELPSGVLDVVYSELPVKSKEIFQKARLSFEEIKVEATPRRIALYVKNLSDQQEDLAIEIKGPIREKCYPEGKGSENSSPTPAFQGWLKSLGIKADRPFDDPRLGWKEIPQKGFFIHFTTTEKGKPTAKVLPEILQEIFGSLPFPKSMRWEKSGFRFPRPLRWIVAILDKKVLPFSFAGLKASNKSFGHRFLAPKVFTVLSADWASYKKLLKKAHVILDLEERKKSIARGLESQFKQSGFDEELLHTTAQLAEEPFLLQGSFSKDYLELPKEVLASCMKKNQKIFACYDGQNYLTGKFVAVLNGRRKGLPKIRSGYENVLESRLKDARYFYKADTKEPLEKKLPLLEQVTYLGKLGNMLDKTKRLEKLAGTFTDLIHEAKLKSDLERAARLSKIDLMTHLVYEFPDLQGIVGREYAIAAGEKREIALALGAQYYPQSLSEDFRELKKNMNLLGALYGLIDRLDLLTGAFGSGIQPSGSQDPYALRRAGGVIVKILRAFPVRFSMKKMVEASAALYGNVLSVPVPELTQKLLKFFEERAIFELQVKPGTREHEILSAVLRSSADDLADVYERYDHLIRLYGKEPEIFIKAAKVVERTGNIVKGVKSFGEIDPAVLKEASEKKLFDLYQSRSAEIRKFLDGKDYEKATSKFGDIFYQPLHDFFEQVMVNVEDASIRANRQALMRKINSLYTESLADLSVLSRLDQG